MSQSSLKIFESSITQPEQRLPVWPGEPYPLGATWSESGVNFSLYSEHAHRVELLLFEHADASCAQYVLKLPDKTGPVWHGFVPGLKPGQLYGYRVYGPFDPEHGHLFNPHKVLLDPYAKAIGRPVRWHSSLFGYGSVSKAETQGCSIVDNAPYAPLGAVIDPSFDWQDDVPPCISWQDTVIYETHVKGISMLHPEVPETIRGTYLGLASDPVIAHLKSLGVTAVQLLPIQSFVNDKHLMDRGLTNYWGYNTLAYFAPEPTYSHNGPITAVNDFKQMVKKLHAEGLEVIIDVVYNHTGEGSHLGPTLSFRGIDNRAYYKLHPKHKQYYMDYTGTGNTLNPGNPYVLQLIMDSLRYWVNDMHVDGFRFDLASALARELHDVDMLSAFFKVIQQDPVLSKVKLIAEPWDVGHGGYQVGNFPWHWTEWNGRYRDSIRSYWRDNCGQVPELATRLAGSSDLYDRNGRKPYASINFITAHDGYTLQDLVSYEQKHNLANGEGNRDGHNHNLSINFGVEGPTDDKRIRQKRERLKRSYLATLFLSQGIPMLLGGDELGRTQQGNNNAYCQDNELNWYDWHLNSEQEDFLVFVKNLLQFRNNHPIFRRRSFLNGRMDASGCKDVSWWHPRGHEMKDDNWQNPAQKAIGMLLCGSAYRELNSRGQVQQDNTFLLILHGEKNGTFALPPNPDGHHWQSISFEARPPKSSKYTPGTRIKIESYGFSLFEGV